eukprot:6042864-Amphidinium_carterae.1
MPRHGESQLTRQGREEYYVYTYVTSYDNVFTDSRRLRETSSSPKGNRERRLETSVSADRARSSVGDVATIIYEAPVSNSIWTGPCCTVCENISTE